MKLNTMLLAGLLGLGLYSVGHAQTITPDYVRSEIQAGQFAQAQTDINSVIYAHPYSFNAYYLLAIDDGHLGDLTGASQALKKAQSLHSPSLVDIHQLELLQVKLNLTSGTTEYVVATPTVEEVPAKTSHNYIVWVLVIAGLLVIAAGLINLIRALSRGMTRVGDQRIPMDSPRYTSYSNQPGRFSQRGGMYPGGNSGYSNPTVINNYNNNDNLLEDIIIADVIEDEIIRDDSFDRPIVDNTYIDNSSNTYNNDSSNSWDNGSSGSDSSNSWDSGSSDSGSSDW
jgi:hypothetical protein